MILLSFFDGIGSASLALQSLGLRVRASLEWEVDEAALAVSTRVCKGLRMKRGDITQDDPAAVSRILQELLQEQDSTVLVTAAPPCVDYSAANGSAQGREGASGSLFVSFVYFLQAIEKTLGRSFPILVENVLLQSGTDCQWFSEQLQAEPIVADGAAFGMISRPRTWWTRVNWAETTKHPYRPEQTLTWDKHQGLRRLQLAVIKDDPSSFDMPGLSFHSSIATGARALPCLTTPAPTPDGRPPPKKMKGKLSAAARQRWLSGNRQYAPWVYEDHALVFEKSGEGQLLPVELKEQLHHFPAGVTRCHGATPKDRHRLLGNSWHLGIARFVMALVLIHNMSGAASADAQSLSGYMDEARARHIPVAGHLSTQAGAAVKPASDMWEQWRHSLDMSHPLLVEPRVEPAISKTVRAIIDIGPEVVQRRAHILRAIRAVRDETQEETAEWFRALPPHVARAYQLEEGQVVQIPLLMHLLRGCGYPDCDNLEADLNQGFPLIGPLRQSPGWHIRTDDWYAHPVSEATFSDLNASHIRHRAARPRADPEWQCMLDEVVAERATGRIEGPFQAHDAWGFQAVAEDATTSSVDLQPMDPGPAYAAFAFSVVQEGSDGCTKVRRCEDYRRSHHNSTIHAVDKPPHDSVETYVRVILFWAFLGFLAQVWCQDLMAAYRQYPVLEVAHAYMLLQLPHGISVWRHAVLPFGASASVWHFNRCRDAVVWLARCLLVVVALHYVDDIGGPEPPWSSQSACTSFRELCELLGIRVKPSKEQPPNFLQKVLGVWIAITREGIEIRPDPGRVQRVQSALQACLDRDELTPEEAARLTGKLMFLQTSLFGQVGRAALHPLYARSYGGPDQQTALNQGLRGAISCLLAILHRAEPRVIPLRRDLTPTSVVYADAFFRMGEQTWKVGHAQVRHWTKGPVAKLENGWGFIVHTSAGVTAGCGQVPPEVVARYGSRKAYIFFLEVNAQILAILANREALGPFWVGFIDNTAGKAALCKGFTSDACINNLLCFFWALCAELKWFAHFEWVASHLNIADPISRGDMAVARRLEASQLQLVPQGYWQLLLKISKDMQYAAGAAVHDALHLVFPFQKA